MLSKNKKLLFAPWAASNKYWFSYQLLTGPLKDYFEEIVIFDPQKEIGQHGKDKANKDFLALVKKEQPDFIFLWIMYDEFYLDTLKGIKEVSPHSIILSYNGDDDYKFDNHTVPLFQFIDYYFITQAPYLNEYARHGKKAFFVCGADTKRFKPLASKKRYDVSFVGSPKSDRLEYLRAVVKEGIIPIIYGSGWDQYADLAKFYAGKLPDKDFPSLINESKINLCFSKNYIGGTHILERFFEINACKSFCLTEYTGGYFPMFTEGKDIATFKSKEELLSKIKYYLSREDERERIAKNAYSKTIKHFSNDSLIRKAMTYIKKHGKPKTPPPTRRKKYLYLDPKELRTKKELLERVQGYDYIFFAVKDYCPLPHRETIQMRCAQLLDKPISTVNALYTSSLIGDYATWDLYYAYDLKDKRHFYNALNLGQVMIQTDYLIKNSDILWKHLKKSDANFITKENTTMISLPLVSSKKISVVPSDGMDHIFFAFFEEKLMILRNQGRLFKDSFLYRLATYSFLTNFSIIKYILKNTLKKTKKPALVKISSFFDRFW